jgi:hypothetical protein
MRFLPSPLRSIGHQHRNGKRAQYLRSPATPNKQLNNDVPQSEKQLKISHVKISSKIPNDITENESETAD